MKDQNIMPIGEVARLFGVNPPTIRRWVDQIPGFVQPFTPAGAQMKFFRHEVMAYLESKSGRK